MIEIKSLFDLSKSIAGEKLSEYNFPWDVVPNIPNIVLELIKDIDKNNFNLTCGNVYIHKTCKVSPTSQIIGPCIICEGSEIRQGAFIRGNVIVGKDCVIGNSCEIKNSIVFDNAAIPHFNYIGDSIIGYKTHLGAGAITSNLKSDRSSVLIRNKEEIIDTKLEKVGAFLGDGSEIGCNAVLNPGTIVGKNTTIYPLTFVRGVVDKNSILKNNQELVSKK